MDAITLSLIFAGICIAVVCSYVVVRKKKVNEKVKRVVEKFSCCS